MDVEIEIKYDVPFEVNEKQYNALVKHFDGILCHRKEGEKFFIKVWLMQHVKNIREVLRMYS